MKHSAFLLALLLLTACSNDDEIISNASGHKEIIYKIDKTEIIVEGDTVLSPKWIQEVRKEISIDDWAIWVYTLEHDGQNYIFFCNMLSSWGSTPKFYTLDGKVADITIGVEMEIKTKRICPFIEGD